MRPSIEEIVAAYLKIYGPDALEEDIEIGESDEEGEEAVEEKDDGTDEGGDDA
mgnify:FL=1